MKFLVFLACSFFFVSCGESASNDADTSAEDEAEADAAETGALAVSSANFYDTIVAANTYLEGEGDETVAANSGFLDLGDEFELNLADADKYLRKYSFVFTQLKVSQDGETWTSLLPDDASTAEFDLFGGTSEGTVPEVDLSVGTYKYIFIEVESATYRRKDCSSEETMDLKLASILVTCETANDYLKSGYTDYCDTMENDLPDDPDTWLNTTVADVVADSDELSFSDGYSADDLFFVLHENFEITNDDSLSLAMSLAVDDDVTEPADNCDDGPGKPTFVFGQKDNIAKALAESSETE